jgi:hypothetical protein
LDAPPGQHSREKQKAAVSGGVFTRGPSPDERYAAPDLH